jgi:hypothetical protein
MIREKNYSNTKRNPLLLLQEPPRNTRKDPELPVRPLQPGAQKATQLIELLGSIA